MKKLLFIALFMCGLMAAQTTVVAFIPDIQFQNGTYTDTCSATTHSNYLQDYMVPWIKAHAQIAIFAGDLTNCEEATEITNTKNALVDLANYGVIVLPLMGNHDNQSSMTTIAQAVLQPGGVLRSYVYSVITGSNTPPHFLGSWTSFAYDVKIGGIPTLVIALQDNYAGTDLAVSVPWAKNLEATWLQTHPNGQVWVGNHEMQNGDPVSSTNPDTYCDTSGAGHSNECSSGQGVGAGPGYFTTGLDLWNNWISTDWHVTLTWGGHLSINFNNFGYLTRTNSAGGTMHGFRIDCQTYNTGDAGLLPMTFTLQNFTVGPFVNTQTGALDTGFGANFCGTAGAPSLNLKLAGHGLFGSTPLVR